MIKLTDIFHRGFLATAALLLSLSTATLTADAEAIDFGYCSDEIAGYGNGVHQAWMGAALKIDGKVAEAYKGCRIDSIDLGMGKGSSKAVTVFLTYSLSEKPFYEQETRFSDYNAFNGIALETPYTIEGREFYVGYRYYNLGAKSTPIGFDGDLNFYNTSATYFAEGADEAALQSAWKNAGSEHGNVSIKIGIDGALPKASAYPLSFTAPAFCNPGVDFDVKMTVANFGAQPLETVTVGYSFNNEAMKLSEVSLESPIPSGETGIVRIPLSTDISSMSLPMSFTLQEVDGTENLFASRSLSGTAVCSDDVFSKAFVVEEFTGVTCGYCVQGIAAFDYFNEHFNYEDDGWIGIAIHNYSADPMRCESYADVVKALNFASAPAAFVNRSQDLFPTRNNMLIGYNARNRFAEGKISIECPTILAADTAVNIKSISRFGKTDADAEYSVSFVLTEDNIGPYTQFNYCNDDPNVPDFYGKGDKVMLMYDDVARFISEYGGVDGSRISKPAKGEDYECSYLLPLTTLADKSKSHLIALLIDERTGAIANACKIDLADYLNSGVDEIADSADCRVSTVGGIVSIKGEYKNAFIYTMTGTHICTLRDTESAQLRPGIYAISIIGKSGMPVNSKFVVK